MNKASFNKYAEMTYSHITGDKLFGIFSIDLETSNLAKFLKEASLRACLKDFDKY